jgi:hypothetical protein
LIIDEYPRRREESSNNVRPTILKVGTPSWQLLLAQRRSGHQPMNQMMRRWHS